MPAPLVIPAGTQFGQWTVLAEAPGRERAPRGKHRCFWCRCACGTEKAVSLDSLRAGTSISCGCSWRDPAHVLAVGAVIGQLTVVAEAPRDRWGLRHLRCRCTCGNEWVVAASSLRTGNTTSCGCFHGERVTKHGMWSSPEYKVWAAMIQRCHNPNAKAYPDYGGRGIQVCERWRRSFTDFIFDVGLRPAPDLTLDRIDNDGHYEPGNVRWATWAEQGRNRRQRKGVA